MGLTRQWHRESGPRIRGSRPLDSAKVQAPCIVRNPTGGYRLFYTAVGPDKPYPTCQGYILSAVSDDGLEFHTEPGIRVAPQPALVHMSLRVLAPSVAECGDGAWRMYFEARGPAAQPTVVCSAVSVDMLRWELEEGIRLQSPGSVRAPRYLPLNGMGRGRLYCCGSEIALQGATPGENLSQGVISAMTSNGLDFEFDPGYRLQSKQADYDSSGFSAAEVIAPLHTQSDDGGNGAWTMAYSAWQDVPPGTQVPQHPSKDVNAVASGVSADFAAASIASDLAGYRSRIYMAYSNDGMEWERGGCAIEGEGYDGEGLDAVHAEDMSLIEIDRGRYRMYYAACDTQGNWIVASAVSAPR